MNTIEVFNEATEHTLELVIGKKHNDAFQVDKKFHMILLYKLLKDKFINLHHRPVWIPSNFVNYFI